MGNSSVKMTEKKKYDNFQVTSQEQLRHYGATLSDFLGEKFSEKPSFVYGQCSLAGTRLIP
jgi:hypothetical protein